MNKRPVLLPFLFICVFLTASAQEPTPTPTPGEVKTKGLALLVEMDGLISQIKSPLTRIRAQLQAAQLIWSSDEKRGSKFFTDATIGFKEYLASLDPSSENYQQQFQAVTQLRYQIIQQLVERDPDAALNFIYSSKLPANPFENRRASSSQESLLEISVANRLVQSDPNRALQIARQTLKTNYSINLISTVGLLRQKNPELAAQFASEIASKLINDRLLSKPEAASVVINLLRFSQNSRGNAGQNTDTQTPLLTDGQYQELLQKAVREALSFSRPPSGTYSPERDSALNLLYGLRDFGPEVNNAAVQKKLLELNPNSLNDNNYRSIITNNSFEAALTGIEKAPPDQREQLYRDLATREANNGETARARQLVNEHVSNPYQRRGALEYIDQQELNRTILKGKVEDALRMIGSLKTARERAQQIGPIANQIGAGQESATAINLLERTKSLLGSSLQAQDQDQMNALIEIARAFGKFDAKRSFEILDPLVDQVNDLCAAARTLEGFGSNYYDDDEFNLQNGNTVSQVVMRMSNTIGSLALVNFERARATSDRLTLPEVRLRVYMEIAQQSIQSGK